MALFLVSWSFRLHGYRFLLRFLVNFFWDAGIVLLWDLYWFTYGFSLVLLHMPAFGGGRVLSSDVSLRLLANFSYFSDFFTCEHNGVITVLPASTAVVSCEEFCFVSFTFAVLCWMAAFFLQLRHSCQIFRFLFDDVLVRGSDEAYRHVSRVHAHHHRKRAV